MGWQQFIAICEYWLIGNYIKILDALLLWPYFNFKIDLRNIYMSWFSCSSTYFIFIRGKLVNVEAVAESETCAHDKLMRKTLCVEFIVKVRASMETLHLFCWVIISVEIPACCISTLYNHHPKISLSATNSWWNKVSIVRDNLHLSTYLSSCRPAQLVRLQLVSVVLSSVLVNNPLGSSFVSLCNPFNE